MVTTMATAPMLNAVDIVNSADADAATTERLIKKISMIALSTSVLRQLLL